MLALAALIGVLSGVAGLYLSYYVAVASGAAIVLIATACFIVAWAATRVRHA
jgi:ABC-type Mn2+/Zn2+ transport system permease subunit